MNDPTPAQIEAAADAAAAAYMREYDRTNLWHRVARDALTAAAQVQPAPEADEREAWLGVLIDTASDVLANDGGYLAADEREQITDALAAALRSQPAPRTVSEAQVDAATAAACAEAGWDWQGVPEEGVPWPHTVMRDIVLATLPALGITVDPS